MENNHYKQAIFQFSFAYAYHEKVTDSRGNLSGLRFIEVNKPFEKIVGLDAKSIIGKSVEEIVEKAENEDIDWNALYNKVNSINSSTHFNFHCAKSEKLFDVQIIFTKTDEFVLIINEKTNDKLLSYYQESEVKYRMVFENANDAIFLMSGDMFIDCNVKTLQIFGCKRDEIVGHPPYRFSPKKQPDGRLSEEKALDKINAALAGKPQRFEWTHTKLDGTPFDTDISLSAFKGSGGEQLVQAIVRDISDKKQAQVSLLKSQKKYKSLFDSMPNGFYRSTPEGYFVDANPAFIEMLGYESLEELKKIYIPDDIYVHHSERDEIVYDNPNFISQYEVYRLKRKDGQIIWIEDNARYIKDDSGIILFHEGICRDITDRKKTEEELYRLSRLQTMLVETSSLFINLPIEKLEEATKKTLSDIGRFFVADRAYIYEYKFSKNICTNTHEWCAEGIEPQLDNLQSVPLFEIPEWVAPHKKGEALYIESVDELPPKKLKNILKPQGIKSLITIPMVDIDKCVGFIGLDVVKHQRGFSKDEQQLLKVVAQLLVNIRNRKLAEKERLIKENLEKKISVAEATLKFKQNFLANMSHEMRTPLTGLLGMAEILEKTDLNEKQSEFLNTLKKSGENLKEIINQVLDFSKLEAGQVKIRKKNFGLNSVFSSAESLFYSICKKPIKFEYHIDPALPEIINADEFRIIQIISNLISNAVKFTEEGKISVSSELVQWGSESNMLEIKISVSDTGKGIPEKIQQQLFKPFSQIEDKDTRPFEGTGLGLSICKELAQLHGGEIGVNSTPFEGSTFWFTFMAQKGKELDKADEKFNQANNESRYNLRILLAEDNKVNQQVIMLNLSSVGHKVTLTDNGAQVLEIFKPGQFDLILMDIQMPEMDGIEATIKLKEKYKRMPPIVGLSANAFEGDREKYMSKGMDEYLIKPLDMRDFEKVLMKLFG